MVALPSGALPAPATYFYAWYRYVRLESTAASTTPGADRSAIVTLKHDSKGKTNLALNANGLTQIQADYFLHLFDL